MTWLFWLGFLVIWALGMLTQWQVLGNEVTLFQFWFLNGPPTVTLLGLPLLIIWLEKPRQSPL